MEKGKENVNASEFVTRPANYVTTVDRITQKIFEGELGKPQGVDKKALWEVPLDGKKGNVIAGVALDYQELIDAGMISNLPKLSSMHYIVHDAIVTHVMAGNRKMSYDMIYRAMTGKISGKVEVTDSIKALIDEALILFSCRVQISFRGKNPSGDEIEIEFDEPLVTYNTGSCWINGAFIEKVVQIPDDSRFDPVLLRWARANGNEIDSRDITLLDIPGLHNGGESLLLKMCLYRRIIKMRNRFDRRQGRHELDIKLRTIRFDYIYDEIGIIAPSKNKRRLIKDKIDRCMKYWTERGLINGYQYKRDKAAGNSYYAVVVFFDEKKGLPGNTTPHYRLTQHQDYRGTQHPLALRNTSKASECRA